MRPAPFSRRQLSGCQLLDTVPDSLFSRCLSSPIPVYPSRQDLEEFPKATAERWATGRSLSDLPACAHRSGHRLRREASQEYRYSTRLSSLRTVAYWYRQGACISQVRMETGTIKSLLVVSDTGTASFMLREVQKGWTVTDQEWAYLPPPQPS